MRKKSKHLSGPVAGLSGAPSGKVIFWSAIGLAAAGAAYWYFVYNVVPSPQALAQKIQAQLAVPQFSLADIKAKVWKAPQGAVVTDYITGYDPATMVVTHKDSKWKGILLDPQHIAMTKNTGETQLWTAS